MNTKRIHVMSFLSLAIALFATAFFAASASAEILPGDFELDAAEVRCSQMHSDPVDRANCKRTWDGSQADEVVCNRAFAHNPNQSSLEREAFRSCLEGYRQGDAHCVAKRAVGHMELKDRSLAPSREQEQTLADACLVGARSYSVSEGAQPAEEDIPSGPTNKLGPAPESIAVEDTAAPGSSPQTPTTCSISGFMGALVCDGMSIVGQMADASLNILGAFMKTPPLYTDPDNPIFLYWNAFRQIANIVFILVFMIVIYSQITGAGISSYSIKRILPRLIAAAILVNVSFYVCSLLVDISNIIGATIYSTVGNLIAVTTEQAPDALQTQMTVSENKLTWTWSSLVSAAIVVIPTVSAFLAWGGFAALLPVVLSVVLAVATTVIVLLLRQVLIILFIIISPLAFVAIVLPNTKEYFDRWSRAFIPTLMLYPVIALVFAAGTVASSILSFSMGDSDYPEKLFFMIMAMGMQIVPLFMVPKILQMGNGMLSSFSGASRAKTAGLQRKTKDFSKKKMSEGDMKALAKPTIFNSMRRGRAKRALRNEAVRNTLEEAEKKYGYNKAADAASKDVQDRLGTLAEPSAGAEDAVIEASTHDPTETPTQTAMDMRRAHKKVRLHAEEVDAVIKQMEANGTSRADKLALINGDDEVAAQAAIKDLVERGDDGATIEIVKASDKFSDATRSQLVDSLENGRLSNHPLFKDQEVRDNIRKGEVNADNFHKTVVAPAVNHGDFSPQQQATMSEDALKEFHTGLQKEAAVPMNQRTVDTQAARGFIENAASISSTPKVFDKLGKQDAPIKNLTALRDSGAFK